MGQMNQVFPNECLIGYESLIASLGKSYKSQKFRLMFLRINLNNNTVVTRGKKRMTSIDKKEKEKKKRIKERLTIHLPSNLTHLILHTL